MNDNTKILTDNKLLDNEINNEIIQNNYLFCIRTMIFNIILLFIIFFASGIYIIIFLFQNHNNNDNYSNTTL